MRYAYLGPAGTFTEAALLGVEGARDAERVPVSSVPVALAAVRAGEVDAAMVPIENSVEGGVTATLDTVATGSELRIVREALVPISFVLVAPPGTALADVRTVSTHSHAWAQVRGWMDARLPDVDYVPASSTAAAALALLPGRPGRGAPARDAGFDAAVCSPVVVEQHPELEVLAEDIGDNRAAVTRFVLVARPGAPLPPRTGADRTTLVIPLWEDRAGALMEILEQFATRGVNLSRIESRPTGNFLGEYFFSVDVDGHILDARVAEALEGLRRVCPSTRFLGSYPRADHKVATVARQHSDGAFREAEAWVAALQGRAHRAPGAPSAPSAPGSA
ncbi:prephenate dehydratase [Kocuria rosea]|uniref:prephenate dehydratase n=1 Tax=Kocuria rosea TaxID=1275 RepID=UPI000AE6B360|nr:prephenate dehydratase [Kocuria polaris]